MVNHNHNGIFLKLLLILMVLAYFSSGYAAEEISNISVQRQTELHNLLIQDCGSCHGMTLKGGLGPALTTDALKNKSRKMIEVTIALGRPGTPMPPWNRILTKEEIHWIVNILHTGERL